MKYQILDDFREFLHGRYASCATVKQYAAWAVRLLEGQYFIDLSGVDMGAMAGALESITKNRNEYSQAKNAILNFAEFAQKQVKIPTLDKPKKRRYRKLKQRKSRDINRKINVIPDKKLLLSYKVMLSTGLRVGELASINRKEIRSNENGGFTLFFVPKRGGLDKVTIDPEKKYICNGISEIIQAESNNDKAFYSMGYLQNNAKKRGFACHDLRRAYAKTTYRDNHFQLGETSEKMRHSNTRTTKIYLRSKVEV